MKSLYLRIWLTVVAALALFALVSGWLVQRHLDAQRAQFETSSRERVEAWADLLQRSLPAVDAPAEEQAAVLRDWSQRLRLPMALDDARGERIAASDSFLRRELDDPSMAGRTIAIRLDDGRRLWVPRPGALRMAARGGAPGGPGGPGTFGPAGPGGPPGLPWLGLRGVPDGVGLAALLLVLLLAVAAGAYPVVRRLTRRLESLKQGVEAFGAGDLGRRVAEDGRDEVAAVGASFNRAATRVEALLRSHQSLLANASHELRSPLARLKMALSLLDEAAPPQRAALQREVARNIAELDALVEEVLLASRLQAQRDRGDAEADEPVALLALAAEEAARVGAVAQGREVEVRGNERLLRRAIRNLLENARRHAGGEIEISVGPAGAGGGACVAVCDRGPGVPEAHRERIFEAFFRLPGQAERDGGVGLGLSLVRQIAERHHGEVRCLPREGGGSCFELRLPVG